MSGHFESRVPLTFWRPPGSEHWPWLEIWVTTRSGGASPPPYAALNLEGSTGDAATNVEANRDLLRRALQLQGLPWFRLRQVHGELVLRAGAPSPPQADGLWTDLPGEVLVVGVADCVPVFLWDARHRRLALLHAGWRGTAAGIVGRGIETLLQAGSNATDLHLAMGPSIGPCCYAVGPEVTAQLPEALVQQPETPQPHLDLRQANRRRALALGVPATQIFAAPPCTGCDPDRFFSHRKLGPTTGRHWALAWMRP